MKDLKCRAWIDYDGNPRMVQVYLIEFDSVDTYVKGYGDDELHPVSEILLYTGFHDKNGEEVYESDICPISGNWGGDTITENGVVKFGSHSDPWFDANAHGWYIQSEHLERTLEEADTRFAIIGNIYESSELLEAE